MILLAAACTETHTDIPDLKTTHEKISRNSYLARQEMQSTGRLV